MENKRQRFLEELMVVHTLADENPCGMKDGLIEAMYEVLHGFIGRYCIDSASKDQVATYLKRDVRTITRWMQQYPDFPKPRHEGHHEVSFNWNEIVSWKLNHKELYN